jgi:hypothetical protein
MAMRVQPRRHEHVHREAERRDAEHARTRHGGRIVQSMPRFHGDERHHAAQEDAVHERGQDLGTVVPERLLRRRRAATHPEREPGQAERTDVGEHVHRVGQERQAVRQPSADELADAERGGDRQPAPDGAGLLGVVALGHAQ